MTSVCQVTNYSYSSKEDMETKNSKLIGKRGHVSPKIYMGFGFSTILKSKDLYEIWLQYNTQMYKISHDHYKYLFYKGRKI
jgi:hypothetical protein